MRMLIAAGSGWQGAHPVQSLVKRVRGSTGTAEPEPLYFVIEFAEYIKVSFSLHN